MYICRVTHLYTAWDWARVTQPQSSEVCSCHPAAILTNQWPHKVHILSSLHTHPQWIAPKISSSTWHITCVWNSTSIWNQTLWRVGLTCLISHSTVPSSHTETFAKICEKFPELYGNYSSHHTGTKLLCLRLYRAVVPEQSKCPWRHVRSLLLAEHI